MNPEDDTFRHLRRFLDRTSGSGEPASGDPPADPPPTLPAGSRVAKYRIVRLLGRGGMAEVHEAEDTELGRRVALKVLRASDEDSILVRRFLREATIAARLQHPHVVPIHELGRADAGGIPVHFIAMELVEGRTLESLLQEKRQDPVELLGILRQAAMGVAGAHAQGIVHRDLKPANIVVGTDGRARVLDFGLAMADFADAGLTRTKAVLGTPLYMAPEQIRRSHGQIGPWTDVHALGVILYRIVTGRLPFHGESIEEYFQQVLAEDPPPPRRIRPSVDRGIESVCMKALQKEPARRYPNALDFVEDLGRALESKPVKARPPSWIARKVRKAASRPLIAVLLAAAIVGAVALSRQLAAAHQQAEMYRRLGVLWSTVSELKADLRRGRTPPAVARKNLASTIADIEAYQKRWPDDPRGPYLKAQAYRFFGDSIKADALLLEAMIRFPEFRPGWSLLGLLRIERLLRIQRGDPSDPRCNERALHAHLEDIVAAFERAGSPGPGRQEGASWGLPWTREEDVIERLVAALRVGVIERKPEEARRRLQEGLEAYQAEEYAQMMAAFSPDPAEQVRWLDRSLALAPGYSLALYDRGVVRLRTGDYPGSEGDFTQAIALGEETPDCLASRGHVREKMNRLDAAIEDYSRALEIDPRFVWAYLQRGNVQRKRGRYEEAIQDYTAILAIDPAMVKALMNRGLTLKDLGRPEAGLEDLNRAVSLEPENAMARYNRGLVRIFTRDPEGAESDLSEAIRLDPEDHGARLNRAEVRRRLGNLDGALVDLDWCVSKRPGEPKGRFNRGLIRGERGDLAGAEEDFTAAVNADPRDYEALLNRAVARARLGKRAEAIADLTQSLSIAPAEWRERGRASVMRDSLSGGK